MGRWLFAWVPALALMGCTGGTIVPDSTGDDDDDADEAGDDVMADDDDDSVSLPGPEIYAVPEAVARGNRLYLVADELPRRIALDIDGVALGDAREIVRGDVTGGLYQVPASTPLGPRTLYVRRNNDSSSVTSVTLNVVEPAFVDVANEIGLDVDHDASGSPTECAESHTGLAFGDYDGDGHVDLYLGNVGSEGKLYRGVPQPGGLPRFEDVTEAAGLSGIDSVAMATFVDLEGDGDADLFIGRRGHNRVLENRRIPEGVARYEDITADVGLGIEDQRTMGVAFGDYDGDGDLDLYVVNHAQCFPSGDMEIRAGDHLYENVDGAFVDRTTYVTGFATESVGFSASWIDVDRDADLDLVIINDAIGGAIGQPNALWRNDGPAPIEGWRFTDVSEQSGIALPGVNGMGLALGDLDDDGAVDLAFSNIGPNHLMLGDGAGGFSDISDSAGIERARLPWGRESITWASHLLDHDNDGDLDLYFSGGRIKGELHVPDAMLEQTGPLTFTDVTWTSGLADPGHGKASALVDLDRDGAWDIVTTNWDGRLAVHHNRSVPPGNHWLGVTLVGAGGNRDAVGAIVELEVGGATKTCFHTNRPSLGAGGETSCLFGLGTTDAVQGLQVQWPDGTSSSVTVPGVDRYLTAVHPDAE